MKNLLLVFPFLSSCFILVQFGFGSTSPDVDFKSDPSTSKYDLLLPSSSLTAPGASASLTSPFSGMMEYNTAFSVSCNQNFEISTEEGIAEMDNETLTILADGFFGN